MFVGGFRLAERNHACARGPRLSDGDVLREFCRHEETFQFSDLVVALVDEETMLQLDHRLSWNPTCVLHGLERSGHLWRERGGLPSRIPGELPFTAQCDDRAAEFGQSLSPAPTTRT